MASTLPPVRSSSPTDGRFVRSRGKRPRGRTRPRVRACAIAPNVGRTSGGRRGGSSTWTFDIARDATAASFAEGQAGQLVSETLGLDGIRRRLETSGHVEQSAFLPLFRLQPRFDEAEEDAACARASRAGNGTDAPCRIARKRNALTDRLVGGGAHVVTVPALCTTLHQGAPTAVWLGDGRGALERALMVSVVSRRKGRR
jgi:hypothetical protein